ncbi:MAG: hypothetical protein GY756_17345 [bacterium]|nr:hypothetical protein [bacterium]
MKIPFESFVRITGLNRSTIYNRINKNKIKSEKDKNGNTYILLDLSENEIIGLEKEYQEDSLQKVENLVGNFIAEYKQVTSRLEDSHQTLINIKDDQLQEKQAEIDKLKLELEKRKGFFKRLFGGNK